MRFDPSKRGTLSLRDQDTGPINPRGGCGFPCRMMPSLNQLHIDGCEESNGWIRV